MLKYMIVYTGIIVFNTIYTGVYLAICSILKQLSAESPQQGLRDGWLFLARFCFGHLRFRVSGLGFRVRVYTVWMSFRPRLPCVYRKASDSRSFGFRVHCVPWCPDPFRGTSAFRHQCPRFAQDYVQCQTLAEYHQGPQIENSLRRTRNLFQHLGLSSMQDAGISFLSCASLHCVFRMARFSLRLWESVKRQQSLR